MTDRPKTAFADVKNSKLMQEVRKEFTEKAWRELGGNLAQILEVVQADKRGRKALGVLMDAGCNPAVVLRELLFYSGSSLGVFVLRDKKSRYAKGQLTTISAQLERDAHVIESIAREVMVDDDYPPYAPVFHIPVMLREAAQSLKDALHSLKRHTHGKTGKAKHLVYLCYHAKAATDRPHYKEIAALIAAVSDDNTSNLIQLADALRRIVKREEKREPQLFKEEKWDIQQHIVQWRKCRSTGRWPTGH